MCAALADDDLLNDGAADGTRLAISAIYAEMILEIAAAIHPVDAGSIAADALLKNGLNGLM